MESKKRKPASRRDFLKTAGLGVGVAAVSGTALKVKTSEARDKNEARGSTGYRESEHIKKYYELARI